MKKGRKNRPLSCREPWPKLLGRVTLFALLFSHKRKELSNEKYNL